MGYEIDFLAVGSASRSGDAIALRYGNLFGGPDEQTVVIIDGGDTESGEALVRHVRTYYGTNKVDWVVSTHPDCDHVTGLKTVVEQMDVRYLLMHKPWEHAAQLKHTFRDTRFTTPGLASRLEKALAGASELQDLAEKRSIPIYEPFAGIHSQDNALLFLGPTAEYYQSLVCQFPSTPAPRSPPGGGLFGLAASSRPTSSLGLLAGALRVPAPPAPAYESILAAYLRNQIVPPPPPPSTNLYAALLGTRVLTDEGDTSPANNSSAILLLQVDGDRVVLTGDAGMPALMRAADYAQSRSVSTTGLALWQVPHHGSKRNVGPTILNRIGGPVAFISAAQCGAPKHPSRRVTNALFHKGTKVYSTCGASLCHSRHAPARSGYGPAPAIPFYADAGEDDE
jgi:beta-lactamase superfamily II metal-dependent hydrolase